MGHHKSMLMCKYTFGGYPINCCPLFILKILISGGKEMGKEEKQAQDELRETEPWSTLLLRQKHHPQDSREALRVPLCVWPAEPAGLHPRGAACHAGCQARHWWMMDVQGPGLPFWDLQENSCVGRTFVFNCYSIFYFPELIFYIQGWELTIRFVWLKGKARTCGMGGPEGLQQVFRRERKRS